MVFIQTSLLDKSDASSARIEQNTLSFTPAMICSVIISPQQFINSFWVVFDI